ncbi:MAG: LicD family protein [Simkaniaceae bacterium]|nr:LicD family protein [Simkaniaceae bacterium]
MFDRFVDWTMRWGMPLVSVYHLITGSIFLNTVHQDAVGFERVGNFLLAPTQYLLAGKTLVDGELSLRFEYKDPSFMTKTVTSLISLPISLPLGSVCKGIGYLSPLTRMHHKAIAEARSSQYSISNAALYEALGFRVNRFQESDSIPPPLHVRRPGDECYMDEEKEALKEVIRLLSIHEIPFWVDCGALLGAYRYGGVIPWDVDIDIAVLQPDSKNVKRVLRALDPARFEIQDWSSRDKPNTYLKVYIRKTGRLIDIYHFRIDQERRLFQNIVSNIDCMFLPYYWVERESRYTKPIPIDYVFPLKKGYFDGIEVPVPNQVVKYLQNQYGENLAPCKVYDEKTGRYERDLSHPYWKFPYAQ